MPQHERGLYEPGEDVRVFDASEEDEDVEGSRLPLLIVLALLVLAMFAGFVWLAYSEGVARGRGETPVITAEAGPARVAPQNPGGTEPYKGFKIYEQPAPPDDDTAQSTAPAQKPSSPPPATKPALTEPTPAPTAPVKKAEAPVPVAPVSAPSVSPAPVKVAAAAPPKPVPAMKPSQLPAQSAAPIGPATAPPRALNATPAPAAPVTAKPVPTATPAAASGGTFVLQIGAYKSQADADTAWTTYKTKHASLLSGYSPDVRQADLGDKGIWYRLRIAGFPSKDVASALCDRLKADGGGCFLGK
jgi:SPOR domain